ncbi:MAG: phosphatidate cytidylyltransferase [Sphingomonadales bacterium]|nr:MAG: phosphatidate cytidylyltransferase [Sphingomonadales bacterium]
MKRWRNLRPGSGDLAVADPERSSLRGELKARIVAGVFLAAITIGAVLVGGFAFSAWVAIGAALVFSEWADMTGLSEREPMVKALALAVLAVTLALGATGFFMLGLILSGLGASLLSLPYTRAPALMHRWVGAGLIYAALPALALIWLRDGEGGMARVLWLLAVVWSTDIGGYVFGRWLGGPKMAPRLSPNKTWAGFVGSMVFALAAGACARFSDAQGYIPPLIAAVALAVVAVMGDLGESALKRGFGVKNSGSIIPGHGGVMDRVDGLLVAAPVFALALQIESWLMRVNG